MCARESARAREQKKKKKKKKKGGGGGGGLRARGVSCERPFPDILFKIYKNIRILLFYFAHNTRLLTYVCEYEADPAIDYHFVESEGAIEILLRSG